MLNILLSCSFSSNFSWFQLKQSHFCHWKTFLVTAAILDGEWSWYINIWIFYMVVLTRFGLIRLYGFRKTFSNDFFGKKQFNMHFFLFIFFYQKSKCLLKPKHVILLKCGCFIDYLCVFYAYVLFESGELKRNVLSTAHLKHNISSFHMYNICFRSLPLSAILWLDFVNLFWQCRISCFSFYYIKQN